MLGDRGIILRCEDVASCKGETIRLSLIDWEFSGFRIDAQLEPGKIAQYNIGFEEVAEANEEYNQLRKSIEAGSYEIFPLRNELAIRMIY